MCWKLSRLLLSGNIHCFNSLCTESIGRIFSRHTWKRRRFTECQHHDKADNQSHNGDEPDPPMWHETYRHCDQVTVCHGLSTILCTSLIFWSSPWELTSWLPMSGLPQTYHFRHQSESDCWTRKNSRFLDLIMQTILLVGLLPFTLLKDL